MKLIRSTFFMMATMLVSDSVGRATVQEGQTVKFGGRRYGMNQTPMLGLWNYGKGSVGTGTEPPPKFEGSSSANWVGYTARWEISDAKLRLKKITGTIDGKRVKNEQILKGRTFPAVAEWFTGRIYLAVGDSDRATGHNTAVIVFDIQKGSVTKMTFLETSPPVHSWNGLQQSLPKTK